MESQKVEPPRVASASRIAVLLLILNVILLGGLLYATFGRTPLLGGGVSLVIVNDTLSPMVGLSVAYPGGTFEVPQLGPGRSVGAPAPVSGEFEAVLTFKDEDGVERTASLPIKPLGELLIVVHVFPEFEEAPTVDEAGEERKAARIIPGQYRILTTYKGENPGI